jgi:hypothetical protein
MPNSPTRSAFEQEAVGLADSFPLILDVLFQPRGKHPHRFNVRADRNRKKTFSDRVMEIINCKNVGPQKHRIYLTEELIHVVMSMTHWEKTELNFVENSLVHQEMKKRNNISVLVFSPAIVQVEVQRWWKRLILHGFI